MTVGRDRPPVTRGQSQRSCVALDLRSRMGARQGFERGRALASFSGETTVRRNRLDGTDESIAASWEGLDVTGFFGGVSQSFTETVHHRVQSLILFHKSV